MHVEDLILVERQLGYRYEMEIEGIPARHYQRVCPPCRRAMFALAQGLASDPLRASSAPAPLPRPAPAYATRDSASDRWEPKTRRTFTL